MTDRLDRRSMLATLGAITGVAALEAARPATAMAEALDRPRTSETWDLSWLDTLKGKHRQVFDCGSVDFGLIVVTNYLDAAQEVYGLSYPDVNTVVGIGGSAFPYNVNDAMWAKYEIGRRWKVKDPAKDAPADKWATKNPFLDPFPIGKKMVGVKLLVSRGTIFWQCNNALNHIVKDLSDDTKQPFDTVRADLVAGLNPWVKLVPAHTFLIGLSQEHGCTYEALEG